MQDEVKDITDRLEEASHFALMDAARGLVIEARDEIIVMRRQLAAYELAFNRLLQIQISMLGPLPAPEDGEVIIDATAVGHPTVREWDKLLDGFKSELP